jgi:pimeloyl-ACP methyl ester carboxylesterase
MNEMIMRAWRSLLPDRIRLGEVDRGGRGIRWVEAGTGGPAVSWAPVFPALAGHTRVIAYDRAGLGLSDRAVGPQDVDSQIADLAAVIDGSGSVPCVLAGHSWGGLLAQALGYVHPELVAGLVLIDPAHEDMTARLPRLIRRALRVGSEGLPPALLMLGMLRPMVRRSALSEAARWASDSTVIAAVADAKASRALHSALQAEREESRGIAASLTRIAELRAEKTFPEIPVVVLSASSGSPTWFRTRWSALQAETAGRLGGQQVVVPGTGHAIHLDRPEAVVDVILRITEAAQRQCQSIQPADGGPPT